MSSRHSWSENPTEQQILSIFNSKYSFYVMRLLMIGPMTVSEMAQTLNTTHYDRIYSAVRSLKKLGLIKVKEYRTSGEFTKIAVFTPTVKNIMIKIAVETVIATDTKIELHSEGFDNAE